MLLHKFMFGAIKKAPTHPKEGSQSPLDQENGM